MKNAKDIGDKGLKYIDEIIETGSLKRLEALRDNPKNRSLRELCKIHQVGPAAAEKFYNNGYTDPEQIIESVVSEDGQFVSKCHPSDEQILGIRHHKDIVKRIPRAMVEEIAGVFRLCAIKALQRRGLTEKELLFEVTGSYRRGKDLSGDVDLLLSCKHPQAHNLLRHEVVAFLENDFQVRILPLRSGAMTFHAKDKFPEKEHLESHDNFLCLMEWGGAFRRVDLIVVPESQWAFALLGWSGTRQFERDIRTYAEKVLEYQLSQQGVFNIRTKTLVEQNFETEEDIFRFLRLKFLPPYLRCC